MSAAGPASPRGEPASPRGSAEQVEWASKWMSATERTSEASIVEQANEWAVQANERINKQVAQYLYLNS